MCCLFYGRRMGLTPDGSYVTTNRPAMDTSIYWYGPHFDPCITPYINALNPDRSKMSRQKELRLINFSSIDSFAYHRQFCPLPRQISEKLQCKGYYCCYFCLGWGQTKDIKCSQLCLLNCRWLDVWHFSNVILNVVQITVFCRFVDRDYKLAYKKN